MLQGLDPDVVDGRVGRDVVDGRIGRDVDWIRMLLKERLEQMDIDVVAGRDVDWNGWIRRQ